MKKKVTLFLSSASLLHAGTADLETTLPSLRLGLKTQVWNGFSAIIEGKFGQTMVDDYPGGAIGLDPSDPASTLIADL